MNSIFHVHILFLLGIVLNVFSGVGYCYFFSRRISTVAPTQGPDASISDIDFRSIKRQQLSYNSYPSASSPPGYHLNSIAQFAALPFPISFQLPQQLIPFAVIPSSAFNQNNQGRQSISTYSAQSSPAQILGDNSIQQSINQNRPEGGHSLHQPAHTAIPAIHFMPCLCNNANKEQRWPKAVYQTSVHVTSPTAYQAIQMVPCYCSVIHDINEQSVPPAASSVSDVSSEIKSATGSTSTMKA